MRVRHLVVGPDEGLVAHRRALLDAVVLPVVKVPRRRRPAVRVGINESDDSEFMCQPGCQLYSKIVDLSQPKLQLTELTHKF